MFALRVAVALLASASAAYADGTTIRVNCGGPAFVDSHGNSWSADTGYNEGGAWTFGAPFSGTDDQEPYKTARYDDTGVPGNLKYSFPVANGWYNVRLHFGDSNQPGSRLAGVAVEGIVAFRSLDIAAEAGVNAALVKTVLAEVRDGVINIELLPFSGYSPLINGIEVLPADPPASFNPIRVNAGGPAYIDTSGNVWREDFGYNAGGTFANSLPINGVADTTIYMTGRYQLPEAVPSLQYDFAVPNGGYEVRLHFADTWATSAGMRIFQIKNNGESVTSNFDITAEGGFRVGYVKSFTTQIVDHHIHLDFPPVIGAPPYVDAIEILTTSLPSTPTNFKATAVTSAQVKLDWIPSGDNTAVGGYVLEKCLGSGCTNFLVVSQPPEASYTDSGLTASTTYRYRVAAVDSEGNRSTYSEIVSAKTSIATFATRRINVGGLEYTDSSGNLWAQDSDFNVGVVFQTSSAISGTSDPYLFQSGRWDDTPLPEMEYTIPAPNGVYAVHMYFFEPSLAPGQRIFDVSLEGTKVLTNFDISAEAGVGNALVKNFSATVTDGFLNIRFQHGPIQMPFISAIEVEQTSAADTSAPSIPAGLAALPVSQARVDLSWSASTDDVGVVAYELERCAGSNCASFGLIYQSSGLAFIDTGVQPATAYRYRIRAKDAAGNYSKYSAPISVTTFAARDTELPSSPSNLAVNAVGPIQVALTWDASTDNVAVGGYRLERCRNTGCTSFAQIATPSVTSYTDSGLVLGVTYRYRVRAIDTTQNLGLYSNIVSATTVGSGTDTTPPTVPATLSASPYSARRIDLSWSASSDNVAVKGYLIERCSGASCEDFLQIANIRAATNYRDTGLAAGTIYRYRVRAFDPEGNLGDFSSSANATTSTNPGTAGAVTYQYDSFGRLKQVTVNPN